MSMFRSLRKKTGSVFRKRKDKSSVSSVASVPSISWPIRDDSYPPSIATEEESTSHTTAVVEEEQRHFEERLSGAKQESNTVVDIVVTVTDPSASHTTAVHTPAVDIPAIITPAVDIPAITAPAVDSTIVDTPAVALEEGPTETHAQGFEFAEEPRMDSYTPKKYVPFVETSAMRSNMFVYPASSYYGMVNPDIMSGFGDDDDSIWLVDDEETDPEVGDAQTPEAEEEGEEVVHLEEEAEEEGNEEYEEEEEEEEEEEGEEEEEVEVEEEEETSTSVSLPRTNQSQPPSIHTEPEAAPITDAQTGFRYRVNLALFDDDFATPEEDNNSDPVARGQDSTAFPQPVVADTQHTTDLLAVAERSDQRNRNQGKMTASSGSSTPATGNPYVDLLEQQDFAMAEAYQRRLDLSGRRGDDEADDFSFGQRYQSDPGTSSVLVTHQRVPSERDGDRDCLICADNKEEILFPRFSPTASCTHTPNACLECLERSIRSDLTGKIWTDIRCPECRELLDYTDIQRYADEETFKRYETLALRAAMAEADNFFWCTSGCGSGQIHDTGHDQPIVICLHCSHRSCFHHNVAWHQGLTCEEYDQLLADPDNFRSKLELDNEAWAASQKEQLEADRAMAQGLLEEERRTREMRERRDRQERERTKKAIELARQIAARRKAEEEMSRETVGRTTKPCPGCGWAIEKNDGCSHMTCAKCKHQFCYECGADHKRILENDNTIHQDDCKFHPNQLTDLDTVESKESDEDDEGDGGN